MSKNNPIAGPWFVSMIDPGIPGELRSVMSEYGKPVDPYPSRLNDGSFIVMGGEINSDDTYRVAQVDFCGKAKRGEAWKTDDFVGLARARLIAAAPDLLEALQYVMSAHGEQLTDAFAQAHKAIAKATGAP